MGCWEGTCHPSDVAWELKKICSAVVSNTAAFIFGSAVPCMVVGSLMALSVGGGLPKPSLQRNHTVLEASITSVETPMYVRQLLCVITKNISAIRAIELLVDQWDTLLLHIVECKHDVALRRLCSQLLSQIPKSRFTTTKQLEVCLNCLLLLSHMLKDCPSSFVCCISSAKHFTVLRLSKLKQGYLTPNNNNEGGLADVEGKFSLSTTSLVFTATTVNHNLSGGPIVVSNAKAGGSHIRFYRSPMGLMIDTNLFPYLVKCCKFAPTPDVPMALETIFGWILMGKKESQPAYYIPHYCVTKLDISTTKLHVVFDASSKISTGSSLNDDYLRIMWHCSPAPYLAICTLRQLARDEAVLFSVASRVLLTDTYGDDVTGADSVHEALTLQYKMLDLLKVGSFVLGKFSSSETTLLSWPPPENLQTPNTHTFNAEEESIVKVFSLQWNPFHELWWRQVPLNGLHSFADSSEAGYAAVYLHASLGHGETQIHLLAAKSRVALLKNHLMSRLELCSTTVGSSDTHSDSHINLVDHLTTAHLENMCGQSGERDRGVSQPVNGGTHPLSPPRLMKTPHKWPVTALTDAQVSDVPVHERKILTGKCVVFQMFEALQESEQCIVFLEQEVLVAGLCEGSHNGARCCVAELLRRAAEHCLREMVQILFARLPQFVEDLRAPSSIKKNMPVICTKHYGVLVWVSIYHHLVLLSEGYLESCSEADVSSAANIVTEFD
ncbi:hypothetical protein PR048_023822 [Dryococelus australis]|uniref:Uncharacterized protein n=1 Tax=Dryococelus australis TaxID=614101 RepID=A0ABQ9GV44_9NEOP|nr:hypothetical protein PR048_023822 [Dryococelus australis]